MTSHIDPELDEMAKVGASPGQVTSSFAIGVGVATWIDLIADSVIPSLPGRPHLLLLKAPNLLVQFDLAMLTHDSAMTSQNILSPDLSQARTIMVSTLTKEPA